ncbi:MAG: hypothetical protein RLZZ49_901 [Bacteroidota bacterium]
MEALIQFCFLLHPQQQRLINVHPQAGDRLLYKNMLNRLA